MSYRLARVSTLTGLRLDDQEDRFRLHLALKILSLQDKVSSPGAPDGAWRAAASPHDRPAASR